MRLVLPVTTRVRTRVLVAALAVSPAPAVAQHLVASVNDTFAPCPAATCAPGFVRDTIGWYFTPGTSITVTSVRTLFTPGVGADRDVAVGLYSDAPAVGGSLLGGGTFNSAAARGTFGGATFGPVTLVGGTQYLVGFIGLLGLSNITVDPASTQLPARYGFDFGGGPTIFPASSRVLLQFYGPSTAVPEPRTWVLVAGGLLALGGAAVRRRRAR